jgi:hypothetical protein
VKRVVILTPIVTLTVAATFALINAAPAAAPDVRFLLQTRAGISAYAAFTDTLPLDYVRPLFSQVDEEGDDYLLGKYTLSGGGETVGLAIGSAGWAVAYHPPDRQVQSWFDCGPNSLPEKAVREIGEAVQMEPAMGYYDFRYPEATGVTVHWLYIANSGSAQSTITLPLENSYIERGYVFCTALTNSEFHLNGKLIERVGSLSDVVRRQGPLQPDQLRAGQDNHLQIEVLSFFGTGFVSGVAVNYEGATPLPITGGEQETHTLAYPAMLGDPLTIHQVHLPVIRKGILGTERES